MPDSVGMTESQQSAPLADAIEAVLSVWEDEDQMVKDGLSDDFWAAMRELRREWDPSHG